MNNTQKNLPSRAGYVRKQRRYRKQLAAVRKSNKGRKQTPEHRESIRESMREFASGEKTVVRATNLENGQQLYFPSGAECARRIGCSKQLVSRAVRGTQRSRTARGWLLERVPFGEILPGETGMSEAERHEFIVTANVSDGDWDLDAFERMPRNH